MKRIQTINSAELYLEVLSLTPCFSWVKTASKEGGTVSTVSTNCCKPLKRFWRRCHFFTQLKQGVNESRPVFARRLRDVRANSPERKRQLKSGFGIVAVVLLTVSSVGAAESAPTAVSKPEAQGETKAAVQAPAATTAPVAPTSTNNVSTALPKSATEAPLSKTSNGNGTNE